MTIIRKIVEGVPGVFITMPDGLEFITMQDGETDAELEKAADDIRAMIDLHDDTEPYYDEDPDSDGYGWERRALAGARA